jgi:hypothetical protein
MKVGIFFAAAMSLCAQSPLGRPLLGQMIDQQRRLRPVYGVSGSFRVDNPIAERVFASACSAALCLAKTELALISGSITTPAPPGGAVIALDSTGATVYFSLTKQFMRWQSGSLRKLDLNVQGNVLSTASRAGGLAIAVERDGVIWISGEDGSILDSLPDSACAVLLLPTLTVYATPDTVVSRKSDGSELRFPASGVESFAALGDGYVEAIADGVLYALRTTAGHEQLFQLPQKDSK